MAPEPDFYTDENGVVHPIPKPKPKPRGGLVAVVLTLALAAGAGGTAAVSAGGSTAGSSTTARASDGGARKARARDRDTRRLVRQLERRGLRAELRGTDYTAECAGQAYGDVQDFLCRHPCQAGFRALLEVRDRMGHGAVVAVAWVDFDDKGQAADFQQLVDSQGTGNLTELTRGNPRYRSVRWSGASYASARDGATVVNVQAQPLGRQSGAASIADQAVLNAI